MKSVALLLLLGLAGAAGAAPLATQPFPLLQLASEREATRTGEPEMEYDAPSLRAAQHALAQANAPADAECAGSLGARVFASLHADLGDAYNNQGDYQSAARAYQRALACVPRDVGRLHELSAALFKARDFNAARDYIQRALALDPKVVYLSALAGNIDFATGRWTDALEHYRYATTSDLDRTRATYWQIMYWLSQTRAGIAAPEMVSRRMAEDWPRPVLDYLLGRLTESKLTQKVREGADSDSSHAVDERLCEALYYVGQARLARGEVATARRYLAATVNVKIVRFNEHSLALAEIARLAASDEADQR